MPNVYLGLPEVQASLSESVRSLWRDPLGVWRKTRQVRTGQEQDCDKLSFGNPSHHGTLEEGFHSGRDCSHASEELSRQPSGVPRLPTRQRQCGTVLPSPRPGSFSTDAESIGRSECDCGNPVSELL